MSDAKDDIFPTARRPAERSVGDAPSAPGSDPPAAPPAPAASPAAPPAAAGERVLLEFGSFREFIDGYSPHISAAGMFLLDSRHPPGTAIAFEVRLSDDFRLVHGRGEIEWTVTEATPDQPAGAAMRFTDLDPPSRRLVARLVDNHRGSGGVPFDIDAPPAVSGSSAAREPQPPIDPSLAPGLGTETLALPISLRGLVDQAPAASAEPPAVAAEEGPATQESPMAPSADDRDDAREADAAPAADAADTADGEGAADAADGAGLAGDPGPAQIESPLGPPDDLPDLSVSTEASDLTPPLEDGFDAAKTQIVKLPEDLRRRAIDEAAIGPTDGAPAEPVSMVEDAGFEPAEWQLPSEPAAIDQPEEALPVIPLTGEDPLAGIEPAESPLFDLAEEAESAEPEVVEDLSFAREVPRPAPVEMPDEEDIAADYYRTSGPPRRGRGGLWVGLCLLAVLFGAAAWRFKDSWIGYLPPALTGGGSQQASGESASPVMGDRPAADMAPVGPREGSAPSADGQANGAADESGSTEEPAIAARENATESGGGSEAGEPSGDEPAAASGDEGGEADFVASSEPAATGDNEASTAANPVAAAASRPAVAAAPSASGDGPARVTGLSFRRVADVTEILISTDAALSPDGFSVVRVAEPPARQVIKIFGPEGPFQREAVAVGSEHVRRLRTGFHRVDGRGEVHVVADLTGPGISVLGTEIRGSTLVVRFGAR